MQRIVGRPDVSPWCQSLVCFLLTGALLAAPEQPRGSPDQLRVGMTAQQVRTLVGPPITTARQVFYQGYLEQWIYEAPESYRLDVLYRQGETPQVKAIHRAQRP
jgi:hypothetical protein